MARHRHSGACPFCLLAARIKKILFLQRLDELSGEHFLPHLNHRPVYARYPSLLRTDHVNGFPRKRFALSRLYTRCTRADQVSNPTIIPLGQAV